MTQEIDKKRRSSYSQSISFVDKFKRKGKRLLGLVAAFTFLSGGVKASTKADGSETKDAGRQGLVQTVDVPKHAQPQITSLSSSQKTKPVLNASLDDYVLKTFQSMAPKVVSEDQLRLCCEAFKTFTTSADGVCFAYQVPANSCSSFLKMALCLPKEELQYLATNQINKMLFSREIEEAQKLLCETPNNVKDFAQRSFECACCYRTHREMIAPLTNFERDIPYIYWDSVNKPTVGKGINLEAHNILSDIRIQNSSVLQGILHPSNPQARSNAPYIKLTREDLEKLTQHVIQKGETNYKAAYFQKAYQLAVHPDDKKVLEDHFRKLLAAAIQNATHDIAQDRSERGPVLLFGTYDNPVPSQAWKVATDISYRAGGLKASPKFRAAYIARDWEKVREECVPRSGKPKDRCSWRQDLIQKVIDQDKSWIRRNWLGCLSVLAAAYAVTKGVKTVRTAKKRQQELW